MADGGPSDIILSWSVANWITVVLMAAVGFGLLGLAQSYYAKKQAASS